MEVIGDHLEDLLGETLGKFTRGVSSEVIRGSLWRSLRGLTKEVTWMVLPGMSLGGFTRGFIRGVYLMSQ